MAAVLFLTTAEIFASDILEWIDDREDDGEVRWVALGRADTDVFRVVYTWRGDRIIRIISAQKASSGKFCCTLPVCIAHIAHASERLREPQAIPSV